jgi:hypothetical protein
MSAENNNDKIDSTGCTFGLGTVVAVALSWSSNHSILWACLHGLFSWFYVIYYMIFKYV